jgi:3-dehydroquinate dehydratase-2
MEKKKIAIINGPNLNLLGKRESELYGTESFESYLSKLKSLFSDVELIYEQSNVEGELVNLIQRYGYESNGIVLNAGGYSHTSIAIADTVAAVPVSVIEVHLTNIHAREHWRHHSLVGSRCRGIISGLGLKGYELAVRFLSEQN